MICTGLPDTCADALDANSSATAAIPIPLNFDGFY